MPGHGRGPPPHNHQTPADRKAHHPVGTKSGLRRPDRVRGSDYQNSRGSHNPSISGHRGRRGVNLTATPAASGFSLRARGRLTLGSTASTDGPRAGSSAHLDRVRRTVAASEAVLTANPTPHLGLAGRRPPADEPPGQREPRRSEQARTANQRLTDVARHVIDADFPPCPAGNCDATAGTRR
jgi:hypothetical protein